jgi:predicted Zn-dependent protease
MNSFKIIGTLIMFSVLLCSLQPINGQTSAVDRALQEYRLGQFSAAERDFREILRQDPSNILAAIYLGQSLFKEKKYADAVGPFEKARELEAAGTKLTTDQHRILVDQLVIAYGISGSLKKVHTLLDTAIRQDPDYPMNYYNLACAFAEEGEKAKMLVNLSTAFQHKDHIIKGEQMPDPRSDDSFLRYVHDQDFLKLMREIGYD